MAEQVLHTPYHQQISLSKAGDVISQNHPTLDNVHLKFVRICSIDRQTGLVSVTGANDHSVNGNRIKKTIEHIQLPVNNYGINTDGQPYGSFPYIGIGDRVLLGYIYGNSATPIVLGVYPDLGVMNHLTPAKKYETTNNNDNFDDYRSQKEVFPSQQVELKKGEGDYERTLNGNSFIARLAPNGTNHWRNDDYTGDDLDARTDQATGNNYHIQNQQAQDWIKVHQSNLPFDQHVTKRMITSNGTVHNVLGSRNFKSDKLTEDASLNKGYTLAHQEGSLQKVTNVDVQHLLSYTQAQIGKHLYGAFTIDKDTPVKDFKHRGYDIYNGHDIKPSSWGYKNEIDYNPKSGASDDCHFVYSCLRQSKFDKMSFGNNITDYDLFYSLNTNYQGSPKAGFIALRKTYTKVHHEAYDYMVPSFHHASILMEDYHGPDTKIIEESKKAKNVIETTLGKAYSSLGPQSDGAINYLVFGQPSKTITSSAKLHLDSNTNELHLSVTDSSIPGWRHENELYVHPDCLGLTGMNHSILVNKNGVYLDHTKWDPKAEKKKFKKMQDQINKLAAAVKALQTPNSKDSKK